MSMQSTFQSRSSPRRDEQAGAAALPAARSPWRELGERACQLESFGPGVCCLVFASTVIGGAARNRRDTGMPASRVGDWLDRGAELAAVGAPPAAEAELLEQVALLRLLMGDTHRAMLARQKAHARRVSGATAGDGDRPPIAQRPLYGPAMHVLLARHDRVTALKIMVAASDPHSRADSLEALSTWYQRQGDVEAGHHTLHAAAAEAHQIEDPAARARRLAGMAHRAALIGDPEAARLIDHARTALALVAQEAEAHAPIATRIARAALLAGDATAAGDLLGRRQALSDEAMVVGSAAIGERDRPRWPGHLFEQLTIERLLVEGRVDPAIQQSKRIAAASGREQAACQIIEHLVERGLSEAALRAASSLALGQNQAVALLAIADRQLRAGQLQAARRTLRGIAWRPGEFYLAAALVSFQSDASDPVGARETIRRLHASAMRLTEPAPAIEALAQVAVSRALLAERGEARPVLERTRKLLSQLDRPQAWPVLYSHLAAAAIWTHGEAEAQRWTESITDPTACAFACIGMAEGLLGTHRSVGMG